MSEGGRGDAQSWAGLGREDGRASLDWPGWRKNGSGAGGSTIDRDQDRSFQVSLWIMLPSLYDHVIVS